MKSFLIVIILSIPFVHGQEVVFMRPNLQNRNWLPLRRGTQIVPLCNPSLPQSCFNQWVQFAQPLSQLSGTRRLGTNYYLPGIMDLQPIESADEKNFVKEGWRQVHGISNRENRYYQRFDSDRIREVSERGDTTMIREGNVVYVSEQDIDVQGIGESHETESDTNTGRGEGTSTGEEEKNTAGKNDTDTQQVQKPQQKKFSITVTRPTFAIRGKLSKTKTLREGCVVIDKQEAGFCFECSEQKIKVTKTPEQMEALKKYVEGIDSGYGRRWQKCATGGVENIIEGKNVRVDKICSPQESLKAILRNFNKTCKPSNFNTFFPELYCQSCQAGVPPEAMLAQMTIESGGKCKSELSDRTESSLGLFQINSLQQSCRGHKKGTRKNRQCLFNIDNNLHYGIKIFKDYYQKVNSAELVGHTQAAVCSTDWPSLNVSQRDSWRRAVSAYNGGPLWIDRSVQAVEAVKPGVGTERLHAKKRKVAGASRLSDVSWEDLRLYYFKERFFSARGNKLFGRSGRAIRCTISNIAHTEAVLGSETKGSPPGLVEYWDQYIKQNRPDCTK